MSKLSGWNSEDHSAIIATAHSEETLVVTLAREKYADLFRQTASRLRQSLTPVEKYSVLEECGRLIIEADELGYLPAIPELRKVIDWHTGDGSTDRKPGMKAVLVRCPYNLFVEVAGGNQVLARQVGNRWTVLENPTRGTSRCGGLLPSSQPATLRLSDDERQTKACEWLAELIERKAGSAADKSTAAPPAVDFDALFEALLRDGRGTSAKLVRFMKDRTIATFQEVMDGAFGKDLEESTVRSYANRATKDLQELDSRLWFETKQTNVIRHIDST